jgi:hypothetical protein
MSQPEPIRPYPPVDPNYFPPADYPPPYQPYPPQRTTNGFAVASMVLGILWLYWIGSILAVIFGHIARHQVRESKGWQKGGGMAMAGLVLGWIGIGFLVAFIFFIGITRAHSSGPCRPSTFYSYGQYYAKTLPWWCK